MRYWGILACGITNIFPRRYINQKTQTEAAMAVTKDITKQQ
jgi:hypothetical protein